MNLAQMEAAKKNMVIWLSDPHELGREPRKIEYAGNFELHDMRYYFFKFKTGLLSSLRIKKQGEVKNFCRSHPAGPRRIGLAQSAGKSTLPTKE